MVTIHGAQLKKSREKLRFWSPLLWSLVVLSSKYRWLWRWSQNTHDTSCGSIDWYNMIPLGDILQTHGSISISMRFTFSPKPKISVLTFIHFKIFKYTRCRYLWFLADFHTHIYYIFINILHIYIMYSHSHGILLTPILFPLFLPQSLNWAALAPSVIRQSMVLEGRAT